jgi:hypothetical protein
VLLIYNLISPMVLLIITILSIHVHICSDLSVVSSRSNQLGRATKYFVDVAETVFRFLLSLGQSFDACGNSNEATIAH